MANEAAQLLDQLMGSARNALPGEKVKQLHWWDEKVCKHYLCGFCPSELFVNTKAEASVGKCSVSASVFTNTGRYFSLDDMCRNGM